MNSLSNAAGWTLTALVIAVGVAGCDDPVDTDVASVRILLTDAPADYIASATVRISTAYLQGGAEDDPEDAGRVVLFDASDSPREFDLMTLRDGVTAELAAAVEVPAGSYGQLRLVVDDATVVLAEGYEFRDGGNEAALSVPSGFQSGIKVQMSGDLEATAGSLTELVVDFDVNDNFKLQGNPDSPAGIQGITFTPLLKEQSRSQSDL